MNINVSAQVGYRGGVKETVKQNRLYPQHSEIYFICIQILYMYLKIYASFKKYDTNVSRIQHSSDSHRHC